MPLIEGHLNLDATIRLLRRWLVNGPPNSGKTYSWKTLPGHVIAITYPRELGHISMPLKTDAGLPIKHYYWEMDPTREIDWGALCNEVTNLTLDILTGKKGPCDTFVGDGIHKLYSARFMAECGGHPENIADEKTGKKYADTHQWFWTYVDRVLASSMQRVVMSCWDGADKDNVLDKSKDAPRHFYPDLPGQAARHIMGKFSVVFSARVIGAGEGQIFRWQTRAGGDTRAAGVKVPPHLREVVSKILNFEIEQDWTKFDEAMVKAVTEGFQCVQPMEVIT